MKKLLALSLTATAMTFAATIDISTGVAAWQVSGPGFSGAATSLTSAQDNPTWAPAPAGSAWVSWSAVQGTSCVVGQTPGNGCANSLSNNNRIGDTWQYTLTISAAALGSNNGSVNFVFGADNRVTFDLGVGAEPAEVWNGGSTTNGTGFNPLGCSGNPPTGAGGTQATYNNCTGTASFNASDLNGDGSLTLTAFVSNDPIPGCPACGDPTGFVLDGDVVTAAATAAPEPSAFGLVGTVFLAFLSLRRISRCRVAPRSWI